MIWSDMLIIVPTLMDSGGFFCLFFNSNYRLILDIEGLLNVSQACFFTPA